MLYNVATDSYYKNMILLDFDFRNAFLYCWSPVIRLNDLISDMILYLDIVTLHNDLQETLYITPFSYRRNNFYNIINL